MENFYCNYYQLYYEFGMHRKLICVGEFDFNCVIDDLSTEFEIVKETKSWDSTDHIGYISTLTDYYLIDYLGNRVLIGNYFKRCLK